MFPNLFIVGAAKSGTTAIYHYLNQHPDICFPKIKEPKFISSMFIEYPLNGKEDPKNKKINSYNEYIALFNCENKKIIADASVDNLYYYDKAIPLIKEYFGDTKILIILRNPIERAYSSYMHLRRDKRESLKFKEGLEEEERRIEKNWEFMWHYKQVGLYYEQVNAYINNFSNVKVVIYDDFLTQPEKTIKEIFDFLNIDRDIKINFTKKYNVSGEAKYEFIHKILLKNTSSVMKSILKPLVKILIPLKKRNAIREQLLQKNLKKNTLTKNDYIYLQRYYQADIKKLSELLNKDLTFWLNKKK